MTPSFGRRIAICKRLKRLRRWAELQAYLESQDFGSAFAELDGSDRRFATAALVKTWVRIDAQAPIPPALSAPQKWTPERVEQLRQAVRRCGGNITEVAKELGAPKAATAVAISRFVRHGESAAATRTCRAASPQRPLPGPT